MEENMFTRENFIVQAKNAFKGSFEADPIDGEQWIKDMCMPDKFSHIRVIPQFFLVKMCKALGIKREEIFPL